MSDHPRDPHHRVEVQPGDREVRVDFAGETIALSRRVVLLFETGSPTRYYIPPEDVRREYLVPSRTRTTCPYKGEASYWTLRAGGQRAEDAVWAYLQPIPECADIAGYFCFYPDKVVLTVEGETDRASRS